MSRGISKIMRTIVSGSVLLKTVLNRLLYNMNWRLCFVSCEEDEEEGGGPHRSPLQEFS